MNTYNAFTSNYLKAVKWEKPKWIPAHVSLLPATWKKYREDLEAVVRQYPRLFPWYTGQRDYDFIGAPSYKQGTYIDHWNCVWENIEEGLEGMVVGHPLADWDALDSFIPPTVPPDDDSIWDNYRKNFQEQKERGNLPSGGMEHGYVYMRLYYLRGFENFMLDVATKDPRLDQVRDMVLEYNLGMVKKQLELGAEQMSFGDDLGMQNSLPISPEDWRYYLKPAYKAIYGTCKEAGAIVRVHSDGHILPVIGDLIECGVDILNPQIGANGLDNLVRACKDRVCVDLDLDRQFFPFATPQELDDHVKEAIDAFAPDNGGLMLTAECAPDVPLRNIEAICVAFEKYTLLG